MTKEQILESANGLSVADRRSIALALWPGVADEVPADDVPVEPAEFWAEMDRRVAAYKADPSRLLTREQFDAAVTQRMAAMRSGPLS